jgi:hypothetical protein
LGHPADWTPESKLKNLLDGEELKNPETTEMDDPGDWIN